MGERQILDRAPTTAEVMVDVLESLRSAGVDISMTGLRVLVAVRDEGTQTVDALARALGLTVSSISAGCAQLVARGRAIGISSNDELTIVLSTAGRRFVDDLIANLPVGRSERLQLKDRG